MSKDVECPYCGKWQEINHDDGYGYDEYKTHEQECADCEKTFAYRTSISFDYDAHQAPCMNGDEHEWGKWRLIMRDPEGYDREQRDCKNCDHYERREELHAKSEIAEQL